MGFVPLAVNIVRLMYRFGRSPSRGVAAAEKFARIIERKREIEMLVLIVAKGKFKVYRERKFPNGYSRQLVATFKTSQAAERFMNAHP
jgi:hypothetical protein